MRRACLMLVGRCIGATYAMIETWKCALSAEKVGRLALLKELFRHHLRFRTLDDRAVVALPHVIAIIAKCFFNQYLV
jgi:hypothetical protein